jgi:hypothetical protein
MYKLLLFFLLFNYSAAQAKQPDFKVYYVKGNCTVQQNGKTVKIKKGDELASGQNITLARKSQLVLIHKSFTTIQLLEPGVFEVSQLAKSIETKPSSKITASYFRYIWDELNSHHDSPENDPRRYMVNTGAASRGCLVSTSLDVDTIYYNHGQLPVYWKAANKISHAGFYDSENEGILLLKQKLSGGPVAIDSIAAGLKKEGVYYWEITGEDGNGCSRFFLQVLNNEDYNQKIQNILSAIVPATPAQTAWMKGFIMEENHFLAEAFYYYKEAIKLDSKNKVYKKAINRFYEIN